MFIDNAVVKMFEGEERYDSFAIAGTTVVTNSFNF
jgi:hypothetical protein